MKTVPDFYAALGVPEHITQHGIRRAYLQKAWKFHPDVNANTSESTSEMSAVNRAYSTLSNPGLRADYDAHRYGVSLTPGSLLNDTVVVYLDSQTAQPMRVHSSCQRHGSAPGLFGVAVAVLRRFYRIVAG